MSDTHPPRCTCNDCYDDRMAKEANERRLRRWNAMTPEEWAVEVAALKAEQELDWRDGKLDS